MTWTTTETLLLVILVFLLVRQQWHRDFYVVRHLGYSLIFKEHPGNSYVTADRGSLIGGHTESFSDFGAAKAFFDYQEGMPSSRWTIEDVNQIYVVRGRKPHSASGLEDFSDKPLGKLIQTTPFGDILIRRREACEEYEPLTPSESRPHNSTLC